MAARQWNRFSELMCAEAQLKKKSNNAVAHYSRGGLSVEVADPRSDITLKTKRREFRF
jgi:hypothetical protein